MSRKIALFVSLLIAFAAFAGNEAVHPFGPLKKVDPKTVCMMNEMAMGKEQIPVEVDGKTYYGCCEMCKKALADKAEKRVATDPVTGRQVDKAKAVIGAQEDGRVWYFESDESLEKHNAQYAKK